MSNHPAFNNAVRPLIAAVATGCDLHHAEIFDAQSLGHAQRRFAQACETSARTAAFARHMTPH